MLQHLVKNLQRRMDNHVYPKQHLCGSKGGKYTLGEMLIHLGATPTNTHTSSFTLSGVGNPLRNPTPQRRNFKDGSKT